MYKNCQNSNNSFGFGFNWITDMYKRRNHL